MIAFAEIVGATGRSPLPKHHLPPAPRPNRRSIRLQGYDYSRAGAYFVTICTQDGECLFGEIGDGAMRLNDAGKIVAAEWLNTAEIRAEIELDEWVIMPNHVHGILVISGRGDRPVHKGDRPVAPTGPKARSIGAVMAGFKSVVTKRVNELRRTPGAKLWQRNYWEHIVRDEIDLHRIREYISNNPGRWEMDKLYRPTGVGATGNSPPGAPGRAVRQGQVDDQ